MDGGKALFRWIPVVAALVVGVVVATWPSLKFNNIGGADFASRFSVIVFFSLLIERTVEILMTIWRSAEANRLEAAVQRLVASNTRADDPGLVAAQESLIKYKSETLQWTMPIAFAFGLAVSAVGVRALSQFIDLTTVGAGATSEGQLWWFNLGDIVFTGALLAGGADPIHKILDLYRKFMESSSARAAGTRP